MNSPARVLVSALFAAALSASSHTAFAYCCIPASTDAGPVCLPNITYPLTQAWNQRCIPFWVSTQGTLFDGVARNLVPESFNVWGDESCTDIDFYDAGDTEDTEPGFDSRNAAANKNVVMQLRPDQANLLMNPNRLAVTITAYSVETGEIFDADILFNPSFSFVDVDASSCTPAMNVYDLRNALVHEIGHVLGFDHPPATETESTMRDSAVPCEVKKRDLDTFDRLGLCTVYGAGQVTKTCAPPANYDLGRGEDNFRDQCARETGDLEEEGCGCTAANGGTKTPATNLVWVALIFWFTKKITRARRP